MKKIIITSLLLALTPYTAMADDLQEFNQQSKMAIKEFAGTLKGALVSAMKSGGPIEAINVCNQVAPKIAQTLSEKYDLTIARTSLKVRNPNNSPDEWEKTVLNQFKTRKADGEDVKTLIFSEAVGTQQMRMMKAIPTGKVCLTCHGSNIAESVQTSLNKLYPDDQATGFSLGDIRGAFSVSKTLN